MASTESEELASLDRVLTRLALTEEDKLEKVLIKLLPIVIAQLKTTSASVRKKVLEILGHVNKRVRAQTAVKLPLEALAELFCGAGSQPMVKSFALIYVEMAFGQCEAGAHQKVVPQLFAGISQHTPQQRDILLRLLVWGLESFRALNRDEGDPKEVMLQRFTFLQSEHDRAVFLDHALKYLLYQPPRILQKTRMQLKRAREGREPDGSQGPTDMEVDSVGGTASQQAADASAAVIPLPGGLSAEDVKRIEGKDAPTLEQLVARKLGILTFLSQAQPPPQEVVLHFVAAACDPNEQVSKKGDELLRKHCRMDTTKPDVDLEDVSLVKRMFSLLRGSGDETDVQRVEPVGYALKARLMAILGKSIAAANCFPDNIEVINETIFDEYGTLRMKQQAMEFAVWVLKFASAEKLAPVGEQMKEELLALLDEDPAKISDPVAITLRAFTYQTLGYLAQQAPDVFQSDASVAERMFRSLAIEPSGVIGSVQGAVIALASAYKGCRGPVRSMIEELLLSSIKSTEGSVRLCSVQWALSLFPGSHCPSKYICILGAGDAKHEIAEEASKGLDLNKGERDGKESQIDSPSFAQFLEFLLSSEPRFKTAVKLSEKTTIPSGSFLALIQFLRQSWKVANHKHADPGEQTSLQVQAVERYLLVLEHALVRDATAQLLTEALEALLDVAATHCKDVVNRYTGRIGLLRSFTEHNDSFVRVLAGRLIGVVAEGLSPEKAEVLLQELTAAFSDAESAGTKKFESQDGSILAAGYLLAQCTTNAPCVQQSSISQTLAALCKALSGSDATLATSAALSLGHSALRGPLPIPSGEATPPEATSTDAVAAPKEGDLTVSSTFALLVKLTGEKDPKLAAKAVRAAGYLCTTAPSKKLCMRLVEGLFELSTQKAEDLQFAVGEALSFAFGGVPVSADTILRTNFASLQKTVHILGDDAQDRDEEMADAQAQDQDPSPTNSLQNPDDLESVQDKILDWLMKNIFSSRREVRTACCVWLVCLIGYTARHPKIVLKLSEIQQVLLSLVGDSNELTQEMASRGLSIVYALGDEGTRQKLVSGLVQVLQGGGTGVRQVKLEGDTKLFEEGQLGKAPGSSDLTTYKELCALATDLGKPDLIYRFMDLANHQMAVNSRRGAAFGFARIAKLAGDELQPHISTLVPRLYRFLHDPNGKVRDAMAHIWHALVPDPKKGVDAHFDAIMKELLKETGSRLWRNRESSCRAMSDLLQGRRWEDLSKHMEQLWIMTLRAMDDIKDSVRQAALIQMRSVKGLTLRLIDPTLTSKKDATEAVEIILPILLSKGLQSSVSEVRSVSMDTIAKLAKAAGPAVLQPMLPDLVSQMLEGLSGLESAKLNYLEQHVEGLGMDSEKLENMRVSASKSTPMGDTLDMCAAYTDNNSLPLLVPKLVELVKRGVGLNTRVGTARFLGALTSRLGNDMKPHAGSLIGSLTGSAYNVQSSAVRKAYAVAASQLARHATAKRMDKIIRDATQKYSNEGGRDEKHVAGMILRELQRNANDVFQANAATIIPVSFLARFDEDSGVAGVWQAVWEEGVASETAALRVYAKEIVDILVAGLGSQQWARKAASAKAAASMAKMNSEATQPHAVELSRHLISEVPGRLWDGKENVLEALGTLCSACPQETGMVSVEIVNVVEAGSARGKKSFKEGALKCLTQVLDSFPDQDHFSAVGPHLLEMADKMVKAESTTSSSKTDEDTAEDSTAATTTISWTSLVGCLVAAWSGAAAETQATHGAEVAVALSHALELQRPWLTRVAALQAAQTFVRSQKLAAKSEECVRWIESLLPGVIACSTDPKVQQLRSTAIECIGFILDATDGGTRLQQGSMETAVKGLRAVVDGDKSSVVRAQAAKLLQKLSPKRDPMQVD